MKVHIEDNLYIESDAIQFVLKEYGTTEKGKPSVKTLGYFTSVEHALQHVLKMKIMQSTATNLKELVRDIVSIRMWLRETILEGGVE